jgi:hypothetical protein
MSGAGARNLPVLVMNVVEVTTHIVDIMLTGARVAHVRIKVLEDRRML